MMLGCGASDSCCKDIYFVYTDIKGLVCEQKFSLRNFLLPTPKPHIRRLTNDEQHWYVLARTPGMQSSSFTSQVKKGMSVWLHFLKQRTRLVNGFSRASRGQRSQGQSKCILVVSGLNKTCHVSVPVLFFISWYLASPHVTLIIAKLMPLPQMHNIQNWTIYLSFCSLIESVSLSSGLARWPLWPLRSTFARELFSITTAENASLSPSLCIYFCLSFSSSFYSALNGSSCSR